MLHGFPNWDRSRDLERHGFADGLAWLPMDHEVQLDTTRTTVCSSPVGLKRSGVGWTANRIASTVLISRTPNFSASLLPLPSNEPVATLIDIHAICTSTCTPSSYIKPIFLTLHTALSYPSILPIKAMKLRHTSLSSLSSPSSLSPRHNQPSQKPRLR